LAERLNIPENFKDTVDAQGASFRIKQVL